MAVIHGTRSKTDVLPSLDLRFSYRKDLIDTISGKNLIDFSRVQSGTSKSTYFGADGLLKYADSNEPRFDHDPATGESLGFLVEEARTNRQPYSSKYDTSHWGFSYGIKRTPNATVAPDGTLTATLIQQDTSDSIHQLAGGFGFNWGYITINSTYTLSLYVKYYNSNKIRLMEQYTYGGSTIGSYTKAGIIFNFETESIEKTIQWNSESQSRIAGYSVNKLPNGWYRLNLSVIPGTDGNSQRVYFGIYPQEGNLSAPSSIPSGAVGIVGQNYYSDTGVANFVGDGSTGVYIWGAQVEQGTFPTSHIPTPATFTSRSTTATYYDANGVIQTAGIDVARDNAYFPDENGVMKPAGLLLEAAGTNLLTYSEEFDFVSWWSRTGVNVNANTTFAPDGNVTADLLIEDSSTGLHQLETSNNVYNSVIGTSYTYSVYVKPNGRTEIGLGYRDSGLTIFNLSTKQITVVGQLNGSGSITNNKIESFPNGWYRISSTIVDQINYGRRAEVFLCNGGSNSYTGDGSSGAYIWGYQIESSPYPTSYIPTTGSAVTRAADVSTSATVTRSADVAQITGTNFSSWYNQSEGTMFVQDRGYGGSGGTGGKSFVVSGSGNTFSRLGRFNITVAAFDSFTTGGVLDVNLSSSTTSLTTLRHAAGLADNNTTYYVNGSVAGTDTACQISGRSINTAHIGFNAVGFYVNSTISRLIYYPQRLPDTTLQKLTE